MKVYLVEPNILDLSIIKQYQLTKRSFKRLFSTDGIFDIHSNNVYLYNDCFCHNTDEIEYDLNGKPVQLLLDLTTYTSSPVIVTSQLPVNYIVKSVERCEYGFHKKSPCKLVVERDEESITTYYFELESMEDLFVQTDLDKLLVMCFYS